MAESVAVIGGGPAGCQAAVWLSKLGISVTLYEPAGALGGLQRKSPFSNSWIAAVPADTLARDLADTMDANVRALGVPVLSRSVVSIVKRPAGFKVMTSASVQSHPAVLLATGTRPRRSGQEDDATVFSGLASVGSFDGKGKRVAILGGGDAAFEAFHILRERGNICRIFARSVRARSALRAHVPEEAIRIGSFSVEGKRVSGDVMPWAFDAAFVLYGWEPSLPVLLGISLEKDRDGLVRVDRGGATSMAGMFAAGDIVSGSHPCVSTALGSAVQAAKGIEGLVVSLKKL